MKKLFVILVAFFMLTSCVENSKSSGGGVESKNGTDQQVVCNESLKVLPIDEPIAMKILKQFSFGQRLYAEYPARVDPQVALDNYLYDGIYYAQNTHDYVQSVKYNEIETFDTIVEMAKKSIIVTPQILTAKFKVTMTHYSENSNQLQVFVRAKGSSEDWKVITLTYAGQNAYVFVETNELGELEYYFEESSYYDWKDDVLGDPDYHCYGFVGAFAEIETVYFPFK